MPRPKCRAAWCRRRQVFTCRGGRADRRPRGRAGRRCSRPPSRWPPGSRAIGERFAEPAEVLRAEFLVAERVAGVGVETGGDDDEIGVVRLKIGDGALGDFAVILARQIRPGGVVAAVVERLGAGSGVGGVLVDGKERHAVALGQDVLGAVAVMHVEVEHGDFFRAGRLGL